jgi:hypothetical protein
MMCALVEEVGKSRVECVEVVARCVEEWSKMCEV